MTKIILKNQPDFIRLHEKLDRLRNEVTETHFTDRLILWSVQKFIIGILSRNMQNIQLSQVLTNKRNKLQNITQQGVKFFQLPNNS